MTTKLPRDRFGRPLPAGSRDELSHAAEPELVSSSAWDSVRRGIALFDERRFYEAHEFFEYAWNAVEKKSKDREFLRGVTQVAVGCCHIQRGNRRGARALLARAAKLLHPYPAPHRGIDTTALIDMTRKLSHALRDPWPASGFVFKEFPTAQERNREG